MIQLPNGHELTYIASSGSLGWDGKGFLPWDHLFRRLGVLDPSPMTVVTKTVTRHPIRGNLDYLKWKHGWSGCFYFVDNEANPLGMFAVLFRPEKIAGTLNAVGLTNMGIEEYIRKYGGLIGKFSWPLVISIAADTLYELSEMAAFCRQYRFVAIEWNPYCPNHETDFFKDPHNLLRGCDRIYNASRGMPLILKLPPDKAHLAAHLNQSEVEAISLNSISARSMAGKEILHGKKSPLEHLGGGAFSGAICQKYYEEAIMFIRQHCDIPPMAPVWNKHDIKKWKDVFGVQAYTFGSVKIRWPWRPNQYIRYDKKQHPIPT